MTDVIEIQINKIYNLNLKKINIFQTTSIN